jgi:hypothetical protein
LATGVKHQFGVAVQLSLFTPVRGGRQILTSSFDENQMIYMNNNQHDTMFIFSLLSYHTSTCFGCISSPSSGGRIYVCGKWYHLPHIYILPPDDGLLICPKHVEV